MKRLLLSLLLLSVLPLTFAQTGIAVRLRSHADCDNLVCIAEGQVCITGETIYCCDVAGGTFDPCGSAGGGGGGTPGGSNTQIQINNLGAFGGDPNFTINTTTKVLTAQGANANGLVSPLIVKSAPTTAVIGDGAALEFDMKNSAGTNIAGARIGTYATVVTAGAENERIEIRAMKNGVMTPYVFLDPTDPTATVPGGAIFLNTLQSQCAPTAGDYCLGLATSKFGNWVSSGGDYSQTHYSVWDALDNRWEAVSTSSIIAPTKTDIAYGGIITFEGAPVASRTVGDPLTFNNAFRIDTSTATPVITSYGDIVMATAATTVDGIDLGAHTHGGGTGGLNVPFTNLSGAATDTQVPNNITIDLATAATALAANGTNCFGNQWSRGVDASGNSECEQPDFSHLSGTATDAQVSDTLTASLFVGSGSTTTAVDLATGEAAGTLPLGKGGTNQASWTASRCVQVNSGGTGLESAAAACGSGGGSPGGVDTNVQFNDSSAFGGDTGLTFNKTTDALTAAGSITGASFSTSATTAGTVTLSEASANGTEAITLRSGAARTNNLTVDFPDISATDTATLLAATQTLSNKTLASPTVTSNLTMSTASATVDGKNLDLILANAKIVNVCSTCLYTTLGAAWAAETSTSANPISYRIASGTFVGQITCSGEDHFEIAGAGRGVTTLQYDTTSALDGVLMMGNCTNYVVRDMTIKGKIYQDLAGTNGGMVVWRNNQILTSDAFGDTDCTFMDQPGAGTRLFIEDNECRTNTDGFTCGRTCANAEFYYRNNTFGPLFASSAANQTMKMVRFNSTPCFVYSQGNSILLDAAKTNGAMELYGYSFDGTEAGGNCAGTGRAFISGDVSYIQNSTSNQAGSAVVYVNIGSGADELDELYLVGNTSLTRSTDADDTTVRNVFIANTVTETYVSGGRYSSSGGTGNLDFETSGSTSNSINIMAVMYASADEDTVNFPFKGLAVDTAAATFTGAPASIKRLVSDTGVEGILLDNTDAVNTEESPYIYMCNGGVAEECFKVFLETDGAMRWSEAGNARRMTLSQLGELTIQGDHVAIDHADPYLRLGNGAASDNGQIWWNSSSTAVQKFNDTNDRMEWTGLGWYRFGTRASNPASCNVGDLLPRDDGTFRYCQAADTWKTGAYIDLAQTWATVQTFTAAPIISGVDLDFEGGASEGFPRLAQSTTPPATACDTGAEAGRLYFDSDADTDGSVFVCTGSGWKDIDDDGAGGGGDSLRVEDGDNAGTFTAMADADFDDSGDINFTRAAGPPDVITATVRADSVALTTDTTGNYAAGDAEAGAALTGDSATAFFSAGAIEAARGGTGDDTSGTTGVPRINAGNWTYDAGVSHLASSTSADLRGALSDETGTGVALFNDPQALDINVEDGTNSVTTVSKVYLLAATCQNATASANFDTPTTNAPATTCVTGTNTQKAYLDFDQTTDESVQGSMRLPDDWTGNVDVVYTWLTTATTGSATWCFQTVCVNDVETGDPAMTAQNSSTCVSDEAKGSASQYNEATDTAITMGTGTPGTCEAGEILYYRISRDPNATSGLTDDLAADARLVGVELTLRRAQ